MKSIAADKTELQNLDPQKILSYFKNIRDQLRNADSQLTHLVLFENTIDESSLEKDKSFPQKTSVHLLNKVVSLLHSFHMQWRNDHPDEADYNLRTQKHKTIKNHIDGLAKEIIKILILKGAKPHLAVLEAVKENPQISNMLLYPAEYHPGRMVDGQLQPAYIEFLDGQHFKKEEILGKGSYGKVYKFVSASRKCLAVKSTPYTDYTEENELKLNKRDDDQENTEEVEPDDEIKKRRLRDKLLLKREALIYIQIHGPKSGYLFRVKMGKRYVHYFACEFISGKRLQDELIENSHIITKFILFERAALSLQLLHQKKWVHHDLSVVNILIERSTAQKSKSDHEADFQYHSIQQAVLIDFSFANPMGKKSDGFLDQKEIKSDYSEDLYSFGTDIIGKSFDEFLDLTILNTRDPKKRGNIELIIESLHKIIYERIDELLYPIVWPTLGEDSKKIVEILKPLILKDDFIAYRSQVRIWFQQGAIHFKIAFNLIDLYPDSNQNKMTHDDIQSYLEQKKSVYFNFMTKLRQLLFFFTLDLEHNADPTDKNYLSDLEKHTTNICSNPQYLSSLFKSLLIKRKYQTALFLIEIEEASTLTIIKDDFFQELNNILMLSIIQNKDSYFSTKFPSAMRDQSKIIFRKLLTYCTGHTARQKYCALLLKILCEDFDDAISLLRENPTIINFLLKYSVGILLLTGSPRHIQFMEIAISFHHQLTLLSIMLKYNHIELILNFFQHSQSSHLNLLQSELILKAFYLTLLKDFKTQDSQTLLAHGLKTLLGNFTAINTVHPCGVTLLNLAVKCRSVEMVQVLLEAKADPNQYDRRGFTALITAVKNEQQAYRNCIKSNQSSDLKDDVQQCINYFSEPQFKSLDFTFCYTALKKILPNSLDCEMFVIKTRNKRYRSRDENIFVAIVGKLHRLMSESSATNPSTANVLNENIECGRNIFEFFANASIDLWLFVSIFDLAKARDVVENNPTLYQLTHGYFIYLNILEFMVNPSGVFQLNSEPEKCKKIITLLKDAKADLTLKVEPNNKLAISKYSWDTGLTVFQMAHHYKTEELLKSVYTTSPAIQ